MTLSNQWIYETHSHTSEGSACAHSSGAELVAAYKKSGYSGLIITDHFLNGNTAVPDDIPWNERIRLFCLGYENAKKAAASLDFDVFFGWEYNDRGTEFLTYGLDQEFLLQHPDMLSWNLQTYFDRIHVAGGFICHAHPFREAPYITNIRLFPDQVDAVEVVNKSHQNPAYNDKAIAYAKKNHLLMLGGSDTHNARTIPGGGVILNRRVASIDAFISAIKQGESKFIQ